jgi:hypothetical protein
MYIKILCHLSFIKIHGKGKCCRLWFLHADTGISVFKSCYLVHPDIFPWLNLLSIPFLFSASL